MSHKPFSSQKVRIVLRSNGFPRVCAIITAFVLSLSASSSWLTSKLYCGIVRSRKTGIAPYCKYGVTVVGNPAATVIISSPRLTLLSPSKGDVSAINAMRFADDPELTSEQKRTPMYSASSFSNCCVYLPEVSQNSKALSTRLHISS